MQRSNAALLCQAAFQTGNKMDPNLLSNALTPIANAVGQWQTAVFALGYPIFWMMAFIELAIVFALMIINRDLPGMINDLVRSVIGISVAYILF